MKLKSKTRNYGGILSLLAIIAAGVSWFGGGRSTGLNNTISPTVIPYIDFGTAEVVTPGAGSGVLSQPVYNAVPTSTTAPKTPELLATFIDPAVAQLREAVAVQQQAAAYQAVNQAATNQAQVDLGYQYVNNVVQPGLSYVGPTPDLVYQNVAGDAALQAQMNAVAAQQQAAATAAAVANTTNQAQLDLTAQMIAAGFGQ